MSRWSSSLTAPWAAGLSPTPSAPRARKSNFTTTISRKTHKTRRGSQKQASAAWVVLTKDKRLRYRTVETHALITAKVRAFVLTARGDLSGAEIGQIFVKALPVMNKLCATVPPPFVAHVSRDGSVSIVKR